MKTLSSCCSASSDPAAHGPIPFDSFGSVAYNKNSSLSVRLLSNIATSILVLWLIFASVPGVIAQIADSSSGSNSQALAPVSKKTPKAAMMRALVPGWGQFYNGQAIKGVLGIAGQGTLIGLALYYDKRAGDFPSDSSNHDLFVDRRNLTFWLMGAFTLFSMLDAYIDAHLHDFDTGPDLSLRIGVVPARDFSSGTTMLGMSLTGRF